VRAASGYSGYGLQYLRRLLRNGKLAGIKVKKLWLVDKNALELYIERVHNATDQRFGPK